MTVAAWHAVGRWAMNEDGVAGGSTDEGTGRRTNMMHTQVHGGRED